MIQDFGEKIGGAKKDLWKERNLCRSDLEFLNTEEKITYVTKNNVWKKPDYQEMVDNGLSIRSAYYIKAIRDSLPTKPYTPNFQENYIDWVSEIRDRSMKISSDADAMSFYSYFFGNDSLKKNIHTDLKVLKAVFLGSYPNEIDELIEKNQFLYTDEQKTLSLFYFFVFNNENVMFAKNADGVYDSLEVNTHDGRHYYFRTSETPFKPENWEKDTYFVTDKRTHKILKINFKSLVEAQAFVLKNYKPVSKTRKKKFVPVQLKNVIRNGPDFRYGHNVTPDEFLNSFDVKGGEFGNWLSENDRQQSLNFSYDAIYDLCYALSINPIDFSLGGKLSIAFGARGSKGAVAHYEPGREVINLTKMYGAGSLAHEWGHALDDIVAKSNNIKGFLSDLNWINNPTEVQTSLQKLMKDIVDTMHYKDRKEDISEATIQVTNIIDSWFNSNNNYQLTEVQSQTKSKLTEIIINEADTMFFDFKDAKDYENCNALFKLYENCFGDNLNLSQKQELARALNGLSAVKHTKLDSDYFKNSKYFDKQYSKADQGYWASNKEMFARAFECYIKDKLEYQSDYLCGHTDRYLDPQKNIPAYPTGEERKAINEKIDKLINFLKEKEILHDYKYEPKKTQSHSSFSADDICASSNNHTFVQDKLW